MKRLIFLGIIVIAIIAGVLVFSSLTKKKPEKETFIMEKGKLEQKKIVMVIAFRDFRDVEYFQPKEILERAGAEVITASNKKGTAIGADGGDTEVQLLVSEVNPEEFDAILFIGGPGALDALDNEDSYKLLREASEKRKLIGAICISPVILAKAGILKGKKATVWSAPFDKSSQKTLEENGAIYEGKSVVIDGKIVTANGPKSAKEFGETVARILANI